MSELKNAPLLEVIFELRWKSDTSEDLSLFEMMLGSIYNELKECFPNIKQLRPDIQLPMNIFVNQPTHRFTSGNGKEYPLFQLGPGVLSINTINSDYNWEDFSAVIFKVLKVFLSKSGFSNDRIITTSLKYLDFYKLPLENVDYLAQLNKKFNFNIEVGSAVPKDKKPILFNIESAYVTDIGLLNFSIKKGQVETKEGIIFESGIQKNFRVDNFTKSFDKWILRSHESLRDFFKDVTKGITYDSFK